MASLESYLQQSGLTQEAFGKTVGVSGVTVHRWVAGKSRPSWSMFAKIEAVTGGAVTVHDFLPAKDVAA